MKKFNVTCLLLLITFCSNIAFGQYTPAMPVTQSGGSNLSNPFGGTVPYSDLRYQYILLKSDLTTGGLIANDVLKSFGIFISGGTSKTFYGLTISLKHTTASTLSSFDGSGFTVVYQGNPYIQNWAGWEDFSFSNSFTWNGNNNILVSICWNNVSTSAGLLTSFNSTGTNRAFVHQATSGTGCNLAGTTSSQNVPQTRFGLQPRVTSFTPITVCASSNQTVVIKGKYFTYATDVMFGGTAATSFTVDSDVQITAVLGAGSSGPIEVTTPLGTGTSTSSITVNPIPKVIASQTSQSICSGSTASVNLSSNVVGTTFNWLTTSNSYIIGESTAAQTGATINDNLTNTTLSPITLIYTVTPNASGCTGTPIYIPIIVKPKPTAIATPNTQSICSGSTSSVSLSSNISGTTFSWSTVSNPSIIGASTSSQTSSNINDNLTNTTNSSKTLSYTVSPNYSGCAGTTIIVPITVNPYPIATAFPNLLTTCSKELIGVSLTSNVSGTTFTWLTTPTAGIAGESSNAQMGSMISDTLVNNDTTSISLNYTVTPTYSGCIGTTITVPITVHPNPIVTANPSVQTICSGISSGISFTSNISGTTFSWSTTANSNIGGESSTIQTGPSITDLLTNTTSSPITLNYSVTPILAGCSGTTITIPLTINPSVASISAGGPTTICEGSQVELYANTGIGLAYQWYLNNIPITAQNNSMLVTDSTGNYNVIILNSYSCSSTSNTIEVVVNNNPPIPIVSPSSPTIFCQGDSVILSVANLPSLTYQWQNFSSNILNANSSQLTVINSGSYLVVVTNTNFCKSKSSIEVVVVNSLPTSNIMALGSTTFCTNDSVILLGNSIPLGNYVWYNQNGSIANSNTYTLKVFESGNYSYRLTDSNSCSNQSDTIEIIVNTHNPSEIYTTSLGAFSLNGITYDSSGIYVQNLQTVHGCDSTITLNLFVQELGIDAGNYEEIKLLFYPNPFHDNRLYFMNSLLEKIEVIEITDVSGQKIDFERYDQMIKLSPNLKSGIYLINVLMDKQSVCYPVVFIE